MDKNTVNVENEGHVFCGFNLSPLISWTWAARISLEGMPGLTGRPSAVWTDDSLDCLFDLGMGREAPKEFREPLRSFMDGERHVGLGIRDRRLSCGHLDGIVSMAIAWNSKAAVIATGYLDATARDVLNWKMQVKKIRNENSVLLQEAVEPHYIHYIVAKD